jgi:hypothetical protein
VKWIKIEEELPPHYDNEESIKVLITNTFRISIGIYLFEKKEWFDITDPIFSIPIENPTHWMRFPKLPKEME